MLHDDKASLLAVDGKWEQAKLQTSWKLEPCFALALHHKRPPPGRSIGCQMIFRTMKLWSQITRRDRDHNGGGVLMYVHFYFAVDFCHSVTDIELLTVSVCPPKPTLNRSVCTDLPLPIPLSLQHWGSCALYQSVLHKLSSPSSDAMSRRGPRFTATSGQPTTGSSSCSPSTTTRQWTTPSTLWTQQQGPHTKYRILLESREEEVETHERGSLDDAELVARRVHVEGAAWPQCSYSTRESRPRHCPEIHPDLTGTFSFFFFFQTVFLKATTNARDISSGVTLWSWVIGRSNQHTWS